VKKYLHFIEQVKIINDQHELTRHEIGLLDLCAKQYLLNEPITVGGLIRQGEIASQPTLHLAFKALIAKKLLTTKRHNDDKRIKVVALTKLALKRYKNLERFVVGMP